MCSCSCSPRRLLLDLLLLREGARAPAAAAASAAARGKAAMAPLHSQERMAVISRHVVGPVAAAANGGDGLERVVANAELRQAPGGGPGTVTLVDNRTGKKYELKVSEDGTIKASDLKKVGGPYYSAKHIRQFDQR